MSIELSRTPPPAEDPSRKRQSQREFAEWSGNESERQKSEPSGLNPGDHQPNAAAASQSAPDKKSRGQTDRIRSNKFDLGVMITKNNEERRNGGRERYRGFRLILRSTAERDAEEERYVGAILPIPIAQKYPELLGMRTVHYQTAYCEERLSPETPIVVAPGQLTTVRRERWWTRIRFTLWAIIIVAAIVVMADFLDIVPIRWQRAP